MSSLAEQRGSSLLFRRYQGNPILTTAQWPYQANVVFNPGAIKFEDETLLLARVEDMRGISHLTVARSKDGKTNWRIAPTPALEPVQPEEMWGVEDPRIVWLQERQEYAICYVSYSRQGPTVSLALTKDFWTFNRLGPLVPPWDKDASLFPRLVKGRFLMIHRPGSEGTHVRISSSPDLKYWREERRLLPARPGWW